MFAEIWPEFPDFAGFRHRPRYIILIKVYQYNITRKEAIATIPLADLPKQAILLSEYFRTTGQ
jgi:hypothetical protein